MDPDPDSSSPIVLLGILLSQIGGAGMVMSIVALLGLLMLSALLSGSEVAFFSLSGEDLADVEEGKTKVDLTIKSLLTKPRTLLATILIGNNVANIAIVILSTFVSSNLFSFKLEWLQFAVQVVIVTFLLVLFGEVIPKIYANHYNLKMARFSARPIFFLVGMLRPFSLILVRSSKFLDKAINKREQEWTVKELNQAIDLTSNEGTSIDEKKILKGVVNFGNIHVKEIMRSRHDTVAHPLDLGYLELMAEINHNRYSRLPIYEESLDKVVGILYIKDLLPYLGKTDGFEWQNLIKKAFFVPEMMKIDDLLKEFQAKKVHMAIVVDEYGGVEGLVTLEDILEEIVGEINDEFDEAEIFYSRLDEHNVVFLGKTSLSDVRKVLKLETDIFDEFKTEVESIGGLMTELAGEIPAKGQQISYKHLDFVIESTDKKRVERVKVTVNLEQEGDLNED